MCVYVYVCMCVHVYIHIHTHCRWYWRAANLGDAQAMHNLGCCYSEGIGVERDDNKAAKWFSEAAVSLMCPVYTVCVCLSAAEWFFYGMAARLFSEASVSLLCDVYTVCASLSVAEWFFHGREIVLWSVCESAVWRVHCLCIFISSWMVFSWPQDCSRKHLWVWCLLCTVSGVSLSVPEWFIYNRKMVLWSSGEMLVFNVYTKCLSVFRCVVLFSPLRPLSLCLSLSLWP